MSELRELLSWQIDNPIDLLDDKVYQILENVSDHISHGMHYMDLVREGVMEIREMGVTEKDSWKAFRNYLLNNEGWLPEDIKIVRDLHEETFME